MCRITEVNQKKKKIVIVYMVAQEIKVINEKGLHARAAAKLVNLASKYQSRIHLRKDSQISNAKSILGILILAACKGDILELTVDGADEGDAMAAIKTLFNSKFQEEE
jgi:phosphocarrier protein HPr